MQLKVIGCHGGVSPGLFTTSYLLDSRVAIDAGALAHRLTGDSLDRITDVFLSHSHHDHLASLPSLVEARIGGSGQPVRLHGLEATLMAIRTHLFNDVLWPDFSRIPGPTGRPVIEYCPITAVAPARSNPTASTRIEPSPITFGAYTLTPVPMQHTVPCIGYLVEADGPQGRSAILVGSDTGDLTGLVQACREVERLAAVIIETSFPDRLADLARLAGHICPAMLRPAVEQIPETIRVAITHLKPEVAGEIREELKRMPREVIILEQDMELEW